MFYKDDWLSWSYDGVKFGKKLNPESSFEFQFKKTINRPLKSHKEELLENTRVIRDSFTEPFDLLFSGGVDSEVVLRCHHALKIPINVFIFKYENDYNYHDVRHALRICNELNITPKVIDFNLRQFFENDAYDIWKTGYYSESGMLPHMKMFDYVDNIPVLGMGNPQWGFHNNQWVFEQYEKFHHTSFYGISQSRKVISDWFEYSPEVILSHMFLPGMQSVTDNRIVGDEFYFNAQKYFLYKQIWSEIEIRSKMRGYEGDGPTQSFAKGLECIAEFRKIYIEKINIDSIKLHFTKQEMIDLLI